MNFYQTKTAQKNVTYSSFFSKRSGMRIGILAASTLLCLVSVSRAGDFSDQKGPAATDPAPPNIPLDDNMAFPLAHQPATYTVVEGDTLFKISLRLNCAVSYLIKVNNLEKVMNSPLRIGQVLINPSFHSASTPPVADQATYTVVEGDSLGRISQKLNCSVNVLISANNLQNSPLRIGQVLINPSVHTAATPSAATTTGGYDSSDGTFALLARFHEPNGVAVDSSGNIYVADSGNRTIRKITPGGVVTTLAGMTGQDTESRDGTGSKARFSSGPDGLAIDSKGNLYVSDFNTIRKITSDGVVTTLAGLPEPPDSNATNLGDVPKIVSGGSSDGTGSAARFNYPGGVAVDSKGNVYVADGGNCTIRRITPNGVVTTLAGTTGQEGSIDDTGSAARFDDPYGVAIDGSDIIYVTDGVSDTIRKITQDGVVTTLAGLPGTPGVWKDNDGNVYIRNDTTGTIKKIVAGGAVTILPGTARVETSSDGIGNAARFSGPDGVAVDGKGNLYVADFRGHTIRKITPGGVVTTLAGSAGQSGSSDGTGSAARFNNPKGLAIDGNGNLYVADSGNNTIRKITPEGVVTTLAGSAAQQ